jgi:hypothetical protein
LPCDEELLSLRIANGAMSDDEIQQLAEIEREANGKSSYFDMERHSVLACEWL